MRRKRMYLYKKTGTYVLCMAKMLEIINGNFEGAVMNLQMDLNLIEIKMQLINETMAVSNRKIKR